MVEKVSHGQHPDGIIRPVQTEIAAHRSLTETVLGVADALHTTMGMGNNGSSSAGKLPYIRR